MQHTEIVFTLNCFRTRKTLERQNSTYIHQCLYVRMHTDESGYRPCPCLAEPVRGIDQWFLLICGCGKWGVQTSFIM